MDHYKNATQGRIGGWLPRAETRLKGLEAKERSLTGLAKATIARQADELYQQIAKARTGLYDLQTTTRKL